MKEYSAKVQLLELPPVDLLREAFHHGEQITRIETIEVARISSEYLIVDEVHSGELQKSIAGPWGQLSEIVVRARIGGRTTADIGYDIIDGFHRFDAINSLGRETINAKVLYGCTDEEMYDLRILAANSVRSVKYPRLGRWMRGAWAQTAWKDKITLGQAFRLALQDSSGRYLKLSESEAQGVKKWAEDKSQQWLMPLGTIHSLITVMEDAAPDLFERIRTGGKFEKGQLSLTLLQLSVIARALPSQYSLQRRVANYAVGLGLSTEQISQLVDELSKMGKKELADKERVGAVIHKGRWSETTPLYGSSRKTMHINQILGPLKSLKHLLRDYTEIDGKKLQELAEEIDSLREKIKRELEHKK